MGNEMRLIKYAALTIVSSTVISVYAADYPFVNGTTQLFSESTLTPAYDCHTLYAPKSSDFYPLLERDIDLVAGQKILLQGQLNAVSPTDSAILQSARMRFMKPGGGLNTAINSGENNVGLYSVLNPDLEPNAKLAVNSQILLKANSTGTYHIFLETRAQTSASPVQSFSGYPLEGPCPTSTTVFQDSYLTVYTGSASTFMKAFLVSEDAEEFQETHRWAAAYGSVNASNSPLTFLNRSWPNGSPGVLTGGTQAAHVSAFFGITVDNTGSNSAPPTIGNTRLVVTNIDQGKTYYFPSENGVDFSASPERHHKKLYLNGVIPAIDGERVSAHIEISYLSGGAGWIHVDTGCKNIEGEFECITPSPGSTTSQANLIFWATRAKPFSESYKFRQSDEGWQTNACGGYINGYTAAPVQYTVSQSGILYAVEGGSSNHNCNPTLTGNLELGFYREVANFNTDMHLTGWTRSTANYSGTSSVINRCVKILDAVTDAILWSQCDIWTNTGDSGWSNFDYTVDTSAFNTDRLRVVVGSYDSWVNYHAMRTYVDDLEIEVQ